MGFTGNNNEGININNNSSNRGSPTIHSDEDDGCFPSNMTTLACLRCRQRKIKCDRAQPCCNRCKVHNIKCTYPQRLKTKELFEEVLELKQQFDAWETWMEHHHNTGESSRSAFQSPILSPSSPSTAESPTPPLLPLTPPSSGKKEAVKDTDSSISSSSASTKPWSISRNAGGLSFEMSMHGIADLEQIVDDFGQMLFNAPTKIPDCCPAEKKGLVRILCKALGTDFSFGDIPIIDAQFCSGRIFDNAALAIGEISQRRDEVFLGYFLDYTCCCNRVAIMNKHSFLERAKTGVFPPLLISCLCANAYCAVRSHDLLPENIAVEATECYFRRAFTQFEDAFDDPSLDTIRCLNQFFVLCYYTKKIQLCDTIGALITRILYHLKLHKKPDPLLPLEVRERHVRIFWWCYYQDFWRSLQLGKPSTINDDDITTDIELLFQNPAPKDADAELVYPYYMSSMTLSRVAKHMMQDIYQKPVFTTEHCTSETISLATVQRHQDILMEWYEGLPESLKFDADKKYTIADYGLLKLRSLVSINIFYHYLIVLLYRKFIITCASTPEDALSRFALEMALRSAVTITYMTGLGYEHELCEGYSFHVGIHYSSLLYYSLAKSRSSIWCKRLLIQNIRNFESSQSYRHDLKNSRQYLCKLKNDIVRLGGCEILKEEQEIEEVRGLEFSTILKGLLEELFGSA